MTNIACIATKCSYNKNEYCTKSNIKVEGLFSRSKLGTFCESFRLKEETSAYDFEIATLDDEGNNKTAIACDANYCKYNHLNSCLAKKITVGRSNATFRGETECETFQVK